MEKSEKISKAMQGNKNACKDRKMTVAMKLRCFPEELDRWKYEAQKNGMSFNTWVRNKLG